MIEDESAHEDIDPAAAEVFRATGQLLSKYKSGKVPKAFMFIPILRNWEEVLSLTNPEGWTPQAHYIGTKVFVSNLKEKVAQRYLNLILLPKVREVCLHVYTDYQCLTVFQQLRTLQRSWLFYWLVCCMFCLQERSEDTGCCGCLVYLPQQKMSFHAL